MSSQEIGNHKCSYLIINLVQTRPEDLTHKAWWPHQAASRVTWSHMIRAVGPPTSFTCTAHDAETRVTRVGPLTAWSSAWFMVLWRKLRARLHCHFDVAFFLPLLVQPVGADPGGMSKFLFNVSNALLFCAMDSRRPVLPSSPTTLSSCRACGSSRGETKPRRRPLPHPATLARRDLTRNEVLTHEVASLVQKPLIDLARETTAVSEDITGLRVEEQLLSQIQHEQRRSVNLGQSRRCCSGNPHINSPHVVPEVADNRARQFSPALLLPAAYNLWPRLPRLFRCLPFPTLIPARSPSPSPILRMVVLPPRPSHASPTLLLPFPPLTDVLSPTILHPAAPPIVYTHIPGVPIILTRMKSVDDPFDLVRTGASLLGWRDEVQTGQAFFDTTPQPTTLNVLRLHIHAPCSIYFTALYDRIGSTATAALPAGWDSWGKNHGARDMSVIGRPTPKSTWCTKAGSLGGALFNCIFLGGTMSDYACLINSRDHSMDGKVTWFSERSTPVLPQTPKVASSFSFAFHHALHLMTGSEGSDNEISYATALQAPATRQPPDRCQQRVFRCTAHHTVRRVQLRAACPEALQRITELEAQLAWSSRGDTILRRRPPSSHSRATAPSEPCNNSAVRWRIDTRVAYTPAWLRASVHSPRPSTPTPTAPHPLRVAMPPMDLSGLRVEEQASPRTTIVHRLRWCQSQDRGSILFRTQSIRPNDARSESVVHAHWVTAATDCLSSL
ncbi:hypothetical protein V8E53_013858 [Lactarius tabidus]